MERRTFTHEFKVETVKLIRNRGVTMAQAAWDLGMHDGTVLRRWVLEYTADSQQALPGQGQMKPEQTKLSRLRHEVITLKAERDFFQTAPTACRAPYAWNIRRYNTPTRGQ